MSSHRPVRSLPLCKCPINFLCNNAKATESDNGNLPKHVAITCDIPAYHKQVFTFFETMHLMTKFVAVYFSLSILALMVP